jgi:hypothetical protein
MIELLEDALGAPVLVPLAVAAAAVSLARSPEWRRRLRALGVRAAALSMIAADTASRQGRDAAADSGRLLMQLTHRIAQAAAEIREEWEDFLAEAQAMRQSGPAASARKTEGGGE